MAARSHLDWPFFDVAHRLLAVGIAEWSARELADEREPDDLDAAVRGHVRHLGAAGWLRHCVPAAEGGASERLDVRSLCVIRETLAQHAALADFAFALQGLGGGPISLFGSPEQRRRYLPGIATGERVAAFALSEPQAGSDVGAIATTATRDGDGWVLDGTKTWISNAGIADQYVVFARTGESGTKGLGAFLVGSDARGLAVTERFKVVAPHPLGTLVLRGCRVGPDALVGAPGDGYRVAMATLDTFRSTVGAAALGFARRALDEAVAHARHRFTFGQPLARHQLVQEKLADMATEIDAAALLVYRAAWTKDGGAERITREAAMAKLYATEAAQRVVDSAVQILGGAGVIVGSVVERLYREVRALRIYEGTSEIQKLIIAEQVLREAEATP